MPYEVMLANGYRISDDKTRLDVAAVHRFLSEESYWARGRALHVVAASIAGSACFGAYAPDGAQAGFARAVTDFATMVHLTDVFVAAPHRGAGLGKALVGAILAHPALAGIRSWSLATDDAHGLYAGFGFNALRRPETRMMRIVGEEPLPQA